MGAERGVVEQGSRDRDVPRGDRRADVVAVNEWRGGFFLTMKGRESITTGRVALGRDEATIGATTPQSPADLDLDLDLANCGI